MYVTNCGNGRLLPVSYKNMVSINIRIVNMYCSLHDINKVLFEIFQVLKLLHYQLLYNGVHNFLSQNYSS